MESEMSESSSALHDLLIELSEPISSALSKTQYAPPPTAVVAAHQFRWFVTQIDYSRSRNLSALAVPCALTALDHWSPDVKRQPRNKEHRVTWLRCVEPLFNGVGLVLLAHFSRIFPLFFKWIHADDDETVLLVLKQTETVIKLTWIRNSPYVERLVDELATLHKEAALKRSREEIRNLVNHVLILLHQCKGLQFEAAWAKHRDDPNLATVSPSSSERRSTMAVQ